MAKGIIIGIVVLLVIVAGVVIFMQFSSDGTDTGTDTGISTEGETGGQASEGTQEKPTEIPPEMQPSVKEFVIEADDRGFYINGADTGSISSSSGEALKITFNVRSTGVYYGGLDFRGCGFLTDKVSPGDSTTVEFSASSTCTITSYWPSSGVKKDSMQVIVG